MSTRLRLLVDLVRHRVEQRVLEDEDGIGLLQRGDQHAAGVGDGRRRERLDPGDVGVPDLEAVLVLRGHLAAAARRHPDDDRDAQLPSGHVAHRGRVVDHLVEREQAEVDRHHLDDRPHPAEGGADPRADEGRLGERGVPHALGAELVEQPEADGERASVAPDVLAHQEDPFVRRERVAHRCAHGLAVGELDRAHPATSV